MTLSELPCVSSLKAKPYTHPVRTIGMVLSFLTMSQVYAGESLTLVQAPGGTDLDQAILPPPGWYGGIAYLPSNRNKHFYDTSGKKVPKDQNMKLETAVLAVGAMYVYPNTFYGGSLASSLTFAAYDTDYKLPGNNNGNSKGVADAHADLIYWTKHLGLFGVTPGNLPLSYGLNVGAGMGLHIPIGKYDKDDPASPGNNLWMPIPNVALTYITGPNMSLGDATEISARLFYGIPLRNSETDYKSGEILNIDYSLVQRFGYLRVGVAGAYQTQTTEDDPPADGSLTNRGKTSFVNAGPIVEYTFPQYGVQLKAKLSYMINPKNTTDTRALVFSASKRF